MQRSSSPRLSSAAPWSTTLRAHRRGSRSSDHGRRAARRGDRRVRDRPAAGRRRSGDRDVAAEAHEHAAVGDALPRRASGAIGGPGLRGRAEVDATPRGTRHCAARVVGRYARTRQPAHAHREKRTGARRVDRARSRGRSRASASALPIVGSRSPSVRCAARSAHVERVEQPRSTDDGTSAGVSLTRSRSESARKRLHARSIASSCSATAHEAAFSATGRRPSRRHNRCRARGTRP